MYNNKIIVFRTFVLRILLFFLIIFQYSCKKYLDKKPEENLAVPSSLNDLRALLNNSNLIGNSPGYLEYVADNFYLSNATWSSPATTIAQRLSYIWDKDARVFDDIWFRPYQTVYIANFVLDNLSKVSYDNSELVAFNTIKGEALFHRSFMFYQLAQLFCEPYSAAAGNNPGIVLRLTAEVKAPSTRASIQQTYDRIITDLKEAVELLPSKNTFTTLPGKSSALGLLARIYLSMRDYTNAGLYAESALNIDSTLLDYNKLSGGSLPFFKDNPEISFTSWQGSAPSDLLGSAGGKIDSFLFASYNVNDLRKTVFYGASGTAQFWKGSYLSDIGHSVVFDGIANDELYLIRAESKARGGSVNDAMSVLNALLVKRYKTGTFTGLTAIDANDAVNQILDERRKELVYRGVRWSDLRRFNLDGANITLKRIINGTTYTLPPNDMRWVLLIPATEITRAGIGQNPR